MIRLEIDGIPPSLNQWMRWHWTLQQQNKQEWAWLIKAACLAAKTGRPEIKLAKVNITLIFPVMRRRDLDNYTPKSIMDGLVNAGILQDDRSDWVDVRWYMVQGAGRKTVIDITEVAE